MFQILPLLIHQSWCVINLYHLVGSAVSDNLSSTVISCWGLLEYNNAPNTIKIVNTLIIFFSKFDIWYCLTGVNEMGFTWSVYTHTLTLTHLRDTFNTGYKNTTISSKIHTLSKTRNWCYLFLYIYKTSKYICMPFLRWVALQKVTCYLLKRLHPTRDTGIFH